MKKGSTIFLRAAVAIMGLIVLVLCIFVAPVIGKEVSGFLLIPIAQYPIMMGLYLTAVFFYAALYQTLKLLTLIDKNNAFSEDSVNCLRYIKYCGAGISILYIAAYPLIFMVADKDDAPGMILMWGGICMAPAVIAVFAVLLQKLLKNAIDVKSENDLTI